MLSMLSLKLFSSGQQDSSVNMENIWFFCSVKGSYLFSYMIRYDVLIILIG